MMMPDETRDAIGKVLGRLPSGISILIAGDADGRETGMLASWVQQASFDPPMVTVAVNRKRYLNDWLPAGSPITLNLLGEDDGRFLKHFGKGFEPDESAFDGVTTAAATNGRTMLAEALGCLAGTIASRTEAGDHFVYVVEITNAVAGENLEAAKPWVHIRKSGWNY